MFSQEAVDSIDLMSEPELELTVVFLEHLEADEVIE
jgi:hypothetical protein